MCSTWYILTSLVVVARAGLGYDVTVTGDSCDPGGEGPWGALLEDWATANDSLQTTTFRHGRIMSLPSPGYYVTERMDGPLVPPPAPPRLTPPQGHNTGQSAGTRAGPARYDEWRAPPGPGKIINRPNPYKDKPYKPSYPAGPIPVQSAVDRVDETPHKQVSETDLFLLSAIEKLVYRVDLMEKRLRKMEEAVHYMVAGAEAEPEPCPGSFTRVGGGCYQLSAEALNWKGASLACRKLRGTLLELDSELERERLQHALLADKGLRGVDWWTGGLNPGLLWIWSHSARPVAGNSTAAPAGDGRCLALVHDASRAAYIYRGRDCGLAHRYICQLLEDKTKLSNEVDKAAHSLGTRTESANRGRGSTTDGSSANTTVVDAPSDASTTHTEAGRQTSGS